MARCLMLRIIVSALFIVFSAQFNATPFALAGSGIANSVRRAREATPSHANRKIGVTVKGSSCVACIKSLQKAIGVLDGVKSVDVEADFLKALNPDADPKPKPHKSKHLVEYQISYDTGEISEAEIETFIKERDFRISSVRVLERN